MPLLWNCVIGSRPFNALVQSLSFSQCNGVNVWQFALKIILTAIPLLGCRGSGARNIFE
jgi:hypothetical protein